MKIDIIIVFRQISKISFWLFFLSNKKRNAASVIFNVSIGINNEIVTVIKSKLPYSSVVKIEVYNGTNKKLSILLPKLLKVNTPIFFIKSLYFFTILTSLYLSPIFI